VVIRYLNIMRIPVTPSEANAPLIVNANAVLTGPISLELLESIPGRDPQVRQSLGSIQYQQLPESAPMKTRWQSANTLALEEPFGVTIPEALYHAGNITNTVNNGKR